MVAKYEKLIVWRPQDGGRVEAVTIPDALERRELEQRVEDLRSCLRPAALSTADQDRIGAAIARMFAGYPSQRNSDARATIATYVLELAHLPAWVVEKACEDIRLGKIPDISPDFPPSTARLNQISAVTMNAAKSEKGNIEALLEVIQLPGHRSEAEQARASEQAAAWLERRDPRARELAAANILPDSAALERTRRTEEAGRMFFARECRAAGIDPANGVSPSLLKTLEAGNE